MYPRNAGIPRNPEHCRLLACLLAGWLDGGIPRSRQRLGRRPLPLLPQPSLLPQRLEGGVRNPLAMKGPPNVWGIFEGA